MVIYIEACESGSMFDRHKLPTNINGKKNIFKNFYTKSNKQNVCKICNIT